MEQRVTRGVETMWIPQNFCGKFLKKGLYFRIILNYCIHVSQFCLFFHIFHKLKTRFVEHFVEHFIHTFQWFRGEFLRFHNFHSDFENFSVYCRKYFFNSIVWKQQIKDVT
jgi:hypothetical protein